MIGTLERRLFAQAWAISVTLHAIAVTLAVLLVTQMKPQPLQDVFQWNVSLVEMLQEQSGEPGTQAAESREPAPQARVQPKQPVTATHVAPQTVPTRNPKPGITAQRQQLFEATSIMERPLVQAPPPAVEHHEAVAQQQEAVSQMDATEAKEDTSLMETQRVEPAPNPRAQSTVSEEPPSLIDTSAPVRHVSPDVDKATVERTEPAQTAAVPKASGISEASPEPPQSMTGTVRQAPAGRADYGWLIESLGKRLAELKRYPATARSNGLEGKVLLRAVIRADGQLADVMVQKSSGYEELDAAAMETMREASPLRLRHELGRAHIVITVPLAYSLAR